MIKVGVIGGTGYVGIELIRLLTNHSKVKLEAISSVSYEGKKIEEVYPNVFNIVDLVCGDSEEVINKCDVIFTALPHGLSEKIVSRCMEEEKICIDIGADFRLREEEVYKEWYNKNFKIKDIHKRATYGLSEIYKEDIKSSKLIANPGCYPTCISLALAPIFAKNIVCKDSLIIDAKSGTTGTGREPAQITHFSECNENIRAYGIGTHRHIPEIEQTLKDLCKGEVKVTFTPHLIPVSRGILSTIYVSLNKDFSLDNIYKMYIDYYKDDRFVRVLPPGQVANIRNVAYSNFCDISIDYDFRTKKLIICSAIDNMIKGAAGQAIQNMNICMGFKEEEGLMMIPAAF